MRLKVEGMSLNGFDHRPINGSIRVNKSKPAKKRASAKDLYYLANSFRVTHKHVDNPELIGLESLKLMKTQSNM